MEVTVKKIYDIAIAHMDEIDAQGKTQNGNTRDYEARTPGLVTALYPECLLYDAGHQAQFDALNNQRPQGRYRPRDPADGQPAKYRARLGGMEFTSMDDVVPLDDELTLAVMPYGLAAALLADENPTLANFLQARYEELLQKFEMIGTRARQPADFEPIADVYGGVGRYDNAGW